MSLLEIGQKPIDNNDGKIKNLETRVVALENNSAKKNQANTFTQNQKIQGQLEIRQNGSAIKVGNTIGNAACYMELFNSNERRAYIGHTSSNNNTFEINNGNNEIKLAGGSVNVNNKKITGVANPTANNDAVNKAYVDGLAQGAAKTNIANTFTTNQKIQGQLEIRKNDDAIKLGSTTNNGRCYIELFNENTSIGMIGKTSETNEFKIDVGGNHINLAGGLVKVNNKRITQVANPTENTDAANKQYVDTPISQIQGVMQQQGDNITTMNSEITKNRTRNQEQDVNIQELQKKVRALENKPNNAFQMLTISIPVRDWTIGKRFYLNQSIQGVIIGYSIKLTIGLNSGTLYSGGRIVYDSRTSVFYNLERDQQNRLFIQYWSSDGRGDRQAFDITIFYYQGAQ